MVQLMPNNVLIVFDRNLITWLLCNVFVCEPFNYTPHSIKGIKKKKVGYNFKKCTQRDDVVINVTVNKRKMLCEFVFLRSNSDKQVIYYLYWCDYTCT